MNVFVPDGYYEVIQRIEFDTETEVFTEYYRDGREPFSLSLSDLNNAFMFDVTSASTRKYFLNWYSQRKPFLYPADKRLLLL